MNFVYTHHQDFAPLPLQPVDTGDLERTIADAASHPPVDAIIHGVRVRLYTNNDLWRRYWINEALNHPGEYPESDLARMRRGLAPQYPETGASMHLHHIHGRGGLDPHNPANLLPLWPWEHYAVHRR